MTEIEPEPDDLGFRFRARKNGEIDLLHHGTLATTLRGKDAQKFLAAVEGDAAGAQQLMARLTGNYRRGNERRARQHPRNRR